MGGVLRGGWETFRARRQGGTMCRTFQQEVYILNTEWSEDSPFVFIIISWSGVWPGLFRHNSSAD